MKDKDTVEIRLRALADPKYREFHCGLIPAVPPDSVLGVRVPEIRRLAKSLDEKTRREFLDELPHRFYDENMLHAAILCNIRGFCEAMRETERFLPYVDNWAVCDALNPAGFSKDKAALMNKIREWLTSSDTYAVRFGLGMLMRHFLGGDFRPEYLELASQVKSDEYYVNMMLAWYFATALTKQWDSAVLFIDGCRLGAWVHNKAIQKACESRQIPEPRKEYLKTKRIKG